MEFLNKLVRFVLQWLAAMGFMLIAPLLYFIPLVFVLLSPPNNDVFPMLAVFQLVTGPFVSAFWTIIVLAIRKTRKLGRVATLGERTLFGMGYMLYGFFGSIVTETIFVVILSDLTRMHSSLGWAAWFTAVPFAIFAPLIIFLVVGKDTPEETERRNRVKSAETIAIEKNYAEACDIIRRLHSEGRFDGKSDKGVFWTETLEVAESALTEEQFDAFKFVTIANDPEEMERRARFRPGTFGEAHLYAPYQQYLYETGRSDKAPPVFPEDEPTKVEVETKIDRPEPPTEEIQARMENFVELLRERIPPCPASEAVEACPVSQPPIKVRHGQSFREAMAELSGSSGRKYRILE